jgi:hypothetical protein
MKILTRSLKLLFVCVSALVLIACGGGAGGTGGSNANGITPTLSLSLKTITISPANTNALSAGQAARASAVYKTAAGQAIPNAIVTFTVSDSSLVTMAPASGTVLTDASGVAFVDIVGKSPNAGGALSISAKATSGTDTIISPVWNVAVAPSTVTAAASPIITLRITDSVSGVVVTNQAAGSSVVAKATVVLADGTPAVNQLVNFKIALDTTLITMSPSSGNALTDSNGVASITVNAKAPSLGGPYSIEATSVVGAIAVTSSASNVQVGAAVIVLGTPALVSGTPSPLPASSTATIQIPVNSNGVAVNSVAATSVSATSSCAAQIPAKAVITVVGVSNGVATINYQNLGCTINPDPVSISMLGALSPANISIPVSAAVGAKLTYIGATPSSNVLVVKGAGGLGRVETGVVSFKLEDISGNPVPNQTIDFSLNTIAGGITLSPNVPIKNSLGIASVRVNSGSLPTPLTVSAKATISTSLVLTAASSVLSISAGPPEQRSMSLSVEKKAIEGWGYDGITSTVTIRMADYWGNAVPDNTAVSFISEGASISNAGTSNGSCLTLNGACSVVFRSQNFRPIDGRVSILAYAEGIEGFIDANGDGIFDAGESCFHSGAPFLDNDESDAFSAGDLKITNIAPSSDTPKVAIACAARAATYVFAQTKIILSTSDVNAARVLPVAAPSFATCQAVSFQFKLTDTNINANALGGNPPAEGTTVAISDSTNLTIGTIHPAVVLSQYGPSVHTVKLSPDTAKCGLTPVSDPASFNIVVTSPSGRGTVFLVVIPY